MNMSENTNKQLESSDGEQAAPADGEQQESVTIRVPAEIAENSSENEQEEPIKNKSNQYGYALLKRPIKYDPIMIVYIVLLFAGGVLGYVNKKSSASLVASTLFSILLAISVYLESARKNSYPLLTILFFLTGMFFYRFYLSGSFVPSGLFGLLSLLMLTRHFLIFYIRLRASSS